MDYEQIDFSVILDKFDSFTYFFFYKIQKFLDTRFQKEPVQCSILAKRKKKHF